MSDKTDIVERLGFGMPINRATIDEAAATITTLRSQVASAASPLVLASAVAEINDLKEEREQLRSQVADLTAQRDAMREEKNRLIDTLLQIEDESDCQHAQRLSISALKLCKRGGGEQEQPEEREPNQNKPIGTCPKCHTPVYTDEGFCGVCRP